ncbi:TetR/AcrR family transcriptional regulator [Tsukamurella ocularis]|uniref:TetR/AcrR family transcriptional regulator n=1 Tax=Tsukamurella ocularis TaxID=1970234 RepID=UPI002168C37F|nr:TetR/AcrR family transcriptional regulator [Tsukamurella ocularis]MCS3780199.1 AcrR family transcriptional regulator [Tsukamurella ocularis]MCS3786247.1 AcrR family transcriptional regulator [Tsukamurella ocularis]MCS3849612.1 AcrR family transcriptional regulator [Tsukamurella ocularis]
MATTTRGRPRSFDRGAALGAAALLFWEKGFEATSIRDLTERLGVEAPSLYRAFGDKRRLFEEAVAEYDRTYGGFIDLAFAEESTAHAVVLRLLAEGPRRYTRAGLPRGCLVVSGDAGTADAEVTDYMIAMRSANVGRLAERIARDVASGELPAAVDATALARFTFATLNGLAAAAREGVPLEELEAVAAIAAGAWPVSS